MLRKVEVLHLLKSRLTFLISGPISNRLTSNLAEIETLGDQTGSSNGLLILLEIDEYQKTQTHPPMPEITKTPTSNS